MAPPSFSAVGCGAQHTQSVGHGEGMAKARTRARARSETYHHPVRRSHLQVGGRDGADGRREALALCCASTRRRPGKIRC